jgi:hypothetical protein
MHCAERLSCAVTMQGGICPDGDACNYTHNVYEDWLHPLKYVHSRTALQLIISALCDQAVLVPAWGGGHLAALGQQGHHRKSYP